MKFCDLVIYTETRALTFIQVIPEREIYSVKRAFLLNESVAKPPQEKSPILCLHRLFKNQSCPLILFSQRHTLK